MGLTLSLEHFGKAFNADVEKADRDHSAKNLKYVQWVNMVKKGKASETLMHRVNWDNQEVFDPSFAPLVAVRLTTPARSPRRPGSSLAARMSGWRTATTW